MISHLGSLSVGLCGLTLLAGCDPDRTSDFTVDAATLCTCVLEPDPASEDPCTQASANWELTSGSLLEVSGYDPETGGYVGTECVGESGGWDNTWYPFTGYKHNVAGTLSHFNWSIPGDNDWNVHVIPDPPFTFMIDEVEAVHTGSDTRDWHRKCGSAPCMEMEISPDKQFWDNPWFFQPDRHQDDADGNGYSWLEGRKLGFYGIWVTDGDHDHGSEIHPAAQFWFKDHWERGFGSSGPFDIFWLLFMQDNTGRFDDRDNFDCGGSTPSGFRPWEDSPRSGQFNIAFEVSPIGQVVTFDINEIVKREVRTHEDAEAREDADEGTTHTLVLEGRELVKVIENQSEDDDLGVTFTNLCRHPNGKLRGFVTLRSKIGGDDDEDNEGFHVLYVVRTLSSTLPPRPDFPRPDLEAVAVRITETEDPLVTGPDGPLGDFEIVLSGASGATADDTTITSVEQVVDGKSMPVKWSRTDRKNTAVLRSVPLLRERNFRVTNASGRSLEADQPAVSLGLLTEDRPHTRVPAPKAASEFQQVIGAASKEQRSDASYPVVAYAQTVVQARSVYSTGKKEGGISDHEGLHAHALNTALKSNDSAALDRIFGTVSQFKITWSVEATDLRTGAALAVHMGGKPHGNAVGALVHTGNMGMDSLTLFFPVDGTTGIVECRIKVHLTDPVGHVRTVEHRLWSHGLEGFKTREDFAGNVEALTGTQDKAWWADHEPPSKPGAMRLLVSPRVRHAHIIQGLMSSTMRDGRATVAEMMSLQKAISVFDH